MSITKEKKAELVKKFGGNEKNTGSVASQVAILTEEIKQMTQAAMIRRSTRKAKKNKIKNKTI